MGMFDYFVSSYNLGDAFYEVECQTKDIERFLGGTMSHYWLDPHGYLYLINYDNTRDFELIDENDPDFKSDNRFKNFRWVKTGIHGKVQPYFLTRYIEIYPSKWDGPWENCPRMNLHFKYGRLMDFEDVTEPSRLTFEVDFLAK